MTTTSRLILVAALALTVVGCVDDATGLEEPAALLSVSPEGGAGDVSVTVTVQIVFDRAMGPGVETLVALHEDDVTGPEVPGAWTLSADRRTMTFAPSGPRATASTYVLHLGGAMMDDHGNAANLERYGLGMGGRWATGSMMMGTGGGGSAHMSEGWRHPTNGTCGMVFTFITGA